MEYQIENRGSYLELILEGTLTRNQILGVLKNTLEEYNQLNYKNLLIDVVNADFSLIRDIDRFFLGKEAALSFGPQSPLDTLIKLAILASKEIYTGFAEMVAKNRGALITVFFEKSEALEWLLT